MWFQTFTHTHTHKKDHLRSPIFAIEYGDFLPLKSLTPDRYLYLRVKSNRRKPFTELLPTRGNAQPLRHSILPAMAIKKLQKITEVKE